MGAVRKGIGVPTKVLNDTEGVKDWFADSL